MYSQSEKKSYFHAAANLLCAELSPTPEKREEISCVRILIVITKNQINDSASSFSLHFSFHIVLLAAVSTLLDPIDSLFNEFEYEAIPENYCVPI